jgi:hypothetical protein
VYHHEVKELDAGAELDLQAFNRVSEEELMLSKVPDGIIIQFPMTKH